MTIATPQVPVLCPPSGVPSAPIQALRYALSRSYHTQDIAATVCLANLIDSHSLRSFQTAKTMDTSGTMSPSEIESPGLASFSSMPVRSLFRWPLM